LPAPAQKSPVPAHLFYFTFQISNPLSNPASGRKLEREKVRETLAEYYRARGWNPATGRPTLEKLIELGLS